MFFIYWFKNFYLSLTLLILRYLKAGISKNLFAYI